MHRAFGFGHLYEILILVAIVVLVWLAVWAVRAVRACARAYRGED